MDDRETELSRFRQQWKEEVTARTRAPTTTTTAATTGAPSSSKSKQPAFSRRLSHSSAHDGEEEGDNSNTTLPLLLPTRDRSTSPVAVRRRSSVSQPGVDVVVPPESALEHYEKAVEKEAQGSLGESLSLYRKAFRMDAKVDSHYREKYFPRPLLGTTSAGGPSKGKEKEKEKDKLPAVPEPTTPHPNALPPSFLASNSAAVASLIASFSHLTIPPALPPTTEDTEPPTDAEPLFSPLTTLPGELLLHILRDLAVVDIASFARCAQVCKALAYLVITEQGIWRDVCTVTYKRMVWDWKVSVSGSELINHTLEDTPPEPTAEDSDEETVDEETAVEENRIIPVDDEEVEKYGGNWRKMFLSRHRVRFNGVYISTCNYVRSGASQSGWNTPVHIVTYYRYLRFYPDGTVLSLLTTHEPAEIVHGFSKPALTPAHLRDTQPAGVAALGGWTKYVSRGRWRVDPMGRVDVETEPQGMDKYLFRMQLGIKSVRAGGRWVGSNKLVWEGFWSWNKLTDDLAEFSLRNDKAFFFSRVGSIEREMGIL